MRRQNVAAAMGIVRLLTGAVAAGAALQAVAETVTVNAPAGTSTNVTQVFTGDTTVSVNTGATGGTVRLSPHSAHTGGTTLGSGTLDVQRESQLGGLLTLHGGNFRYSGPAGATWTTAITNAAPNAAVSQNWRIDSDLTMAGDIWSTDGLFVKTGPATLTLTSPFYLGAETSNLGTRGTLINLGDDRAPTTGLSGATIAEGTVVVNTPYDASVTNKFSACSNASLIGVRTTNAVNEATLIVSNGITRTHAALVVGAGYGKGNGGSLLKGRLEVAGGTLMVGNTAANILYTGINNYPNELRVETVVDVSSAQRLNCKGYYPAYDKNTYSLTYVHDGGKIYTHDGHILVANGTSDATVTNDFIITGSGSNVDCQNFSNDPKNGGATTNLRIEDGGRIDMRNFVNSDKGTFDVVFDGAIWHHRSHATETPHFPSSMTSMKIGPGGLTASFYAGSDLYPVIWDKGLEPLDDSGTDGGISVSMGSGTLTPLLIRGINTYCGPTYISFTRVYLGGAGRLPSGTALTVTGDNGGLIVTNGIQTVGSFTFGTVGKNYGPILGFDKGSRLDVTGDVTVGNLESPKLHLFETRGVTNHPVNGLSSPGVYTFVTAPAAALDGLQQMAQAFTYTYQPENVAYTCYATVEDGRAKLKVAVTAAYGTAAVDGTTLVLPSTTNSPLAATSEQLAAAAVILANPQQCTLGAGTVELGALGGFAAGGRLVAGSGRTRVSDLSFVQSMDDLVLTTGTLEYTGPTASIPGFTIDGTYWRSSVLSVTDPNATLTIAGVNDVYGSFTKMGPGTLHLGGTGAFAWHTEHRDFNNAAPGVAPNGDGPLYGHRTFNVNGGAVTIGTLGDPNDAPTMSVGHEMSVGSRSHQAGQGVQTAGTMTLNNGFLAASNTFMIGYYSGNPDDVPDAMLYPTFTMNGGAAYMASLRLGHGASRQTCNPSYIQHGGTNWIEGAIYLGYQAVHTQGVYRATFLVDGGLVSCGNHIYTGNAANTMGADVVITNGGRVVVNNGKNVTINHANARETNTLVLASGGTLRCCSLHTGSAAFAYPAVAHFDGGIFESSLYSGATPCFRYFQHAYLGKDGLTIDLSHQCEYDGTQDRWLSVQQAFEPDPDLPEGVSDGGLTFTGKGNVATYNAFGESTFTGGIHVRDGARYVIAGSTAAAPFTADFAPGTIVSTYEDVNTIGSLVLGEAGATEPVTLEVRVDQPGSVGVVVSNALSVLSPVAVTTRSGTYDFDCTPRVGTYTALVYSASNADVDLSLFRAPAQSRFTMTARQETISGGDLDGMKAVVVTFANAANAASGGPVWTSVSAGGAWADSANWNGTAPPSGETARAVFNAATKANVPVTLADGVTVGTLDFVASKASYGYELSGGSVTLGGAGRTGRIVNASGTNTVASPVVAAGDTSLETDAGNELRLTGGVSGDGDLAVNTHVETGAGQVNLKVAPGYTGKITTGSGRVVMDDLSFIQSPDQLTLGPSTFLYTGPAAEIPGFQLKGRAGQACVVQHDADLTVNSLVNGGTSALLKLGTGTLHLNGTGTFAVNTHQDNNGSGKTPVFPNGDGPTKAVRGFAVSSGTFEMGVAGDPENTPTLTLAKHQIGVGNPTSVKNGSATFILNNGRIESSSQIYICYYSTAGNMLTFRQNGGEIECSGSLGCAYQGNGNMDVDTLYEMNGGTAWFSGNLLMGQGKAVSPDTRTCRFVVNGGTLAFGGYAAFVSRTTERSNDAFVELNGGLLAVTGNVDFVSFTDDYAEARLNAGATWEVGGALTQTVADATGILYGNGGTLRPLGLTEAGRTVSALSHIYASTNGLVVDTSRFAADVPFTIAQAIETDPALGGAADGGLVKRGKGVLALGAANTFTGPARVEGGVLSLGVPGALAGSAVELAGGSLAVGCGSATVGGLAGGGAVLGGDIAVTGALAPAAGTDGYFYVAGALTVDKDAVLDLSAFDDGALAPGDALFLAEVGGAVTVPARLKVTPAAKLAQPGLAAKTSVEDGCLYVTIASGGTTIVIR